MICLNFSLHFYLNLNEWNGFLKKIIPLLVLLTALFSGCSIQNYTPELVDFNQNSAYTSGDFFCSCNITLDENIVTVTATSTNANGLTISYNGSEVKYLYGDMSYVIAPEKNTANPAVIIYDALQSLKESEQNNVSKTEDGFEYKGNTSIGDFVLLQYDDNTYKSLYFPDADIKFEFY